jgi:hypothetical protein
MAAAPQAPHGDAPRDRRDDRQHHREHHRDPGDHPRSGVRRPVFVAATGVADHEGDSDGRGNGVEPRLRTPDQGPSHHQATMTAI